MNQITVTTTASTLVETIEHIEGPTPGTYWRFRQDLPTPTTTSQMSAGPLSAGTVLLLKEIEFADGIPHVYIFVAHPDSPKKQRGDERFHADIFWDYWEPALDGEAVRASELLALQQRMAETQRKLMEPPPTAAPASLLAHNPLDAVGAEGQALCTPDQTSAIEVYAARLQADAAARKEWIETNSAELGEQSTHLANFYAERAQAMLARATAQLDSVKRILTTVDNLRLYTGEGVEATLLRDGAPAPHEARLTLYQESLAFDEETAALLDQGGLDHTQFNALIQCLEDPALVDRMLPAPRSVVLVQFRRQNKDFFRGRQEDLAKAIANEQLNAESQRQHLLIRDGGRLVLVDCPSVLDKIKQLLPSAAEQSSYYRRRDVELTRDHMDYAAAQRKQMAALDAYTQVLIILWGLHDREHLFAASSIPRFANWLDPSFQLAHIDLLSEDTLIGVTRPSYSEWRVAHNRHLAQGAWVAVEAGELFDQKFLPAAYASTPYYTRSGAEYPRRYDLASESTTVIGRVRAGDKGLYVEVPLKARVEDDSGTRRRITGKLLLKPEATSRVLVLDRVHAVDLDYYLSSRKQRRGYASYLALFREARRWVGARDAREAPLRAALADAATQARLPVEPDDLDRAITDALATSRVAHKAADAPLPGERGYDGFVKGALALLHAALVGNQARVAAIEAWAAREGRTPLRLVLTGRQEWLLYAAPSLDEHNPQLGEPRHASRLSVRFLAEGSAELSFKDRALLRAAAGEQVMHDWSGAADWLTKKPLFPIDYATAARVLASIPEHATALDTLPDPADIVDLAYQYSRTRSKGVVERMRLRVPVGTVLENDKPGVLLLEVDAWGWAYQNGNAVVKAQCERAIERIYLHPQINLEELRNGSWHWRESYALLTTIPKQDSKGWLHEGPSFYLHESQCVASPAYNPADLRQAIRITSLTSQGARLCPQLASLAESPAGTNTG